MRNCSAPVNARCLDGHSMRPEDAANLAEQIEAARRHEQELADKFGGRLPCPELYLDEIIALPIGRPCTEAP